MLHRLMILAAVALVRPASASIFEFNDRAGFDRCLETSSLEEVSNEGGKLQKRWLPEMEIKERCAKRAVEIAPKLKGGEQLADWIDATRVKAGAQLALPLALRAVQANLALCNDMKVYRVILGTLQHPRSTRESKADFEIAKSVVTVCLKDKEFKTDFLDEAENEDRYIRENACEILKAANLKNCGGKK